ncbi:MAG TPA: hypothetical protein VFY14_20880 [Streptomyces sp.]|nr:hypothetical protein [Streptomyces sp.]
MFQKASREMSRSGSRPPTGVLRRAAAVLATVTAAVVTGCQLEGGTAVPEVSRSAAPEASPSADTSAPPAAPSTTPPAAPSTAPGGERTLVDADIAGGLRKLAGQSAISDVPIDPGELRDGMNLVISSFAPPSGVGGTIVFVGVDRVPEDPGKRREHLFRGMLDYIEWDHELGQPLAQPVNPGPLGGSVECLLASLVEDGDVICGWADDSTAAVALFPDSTPARAGKLFVDMRADLER